MYIDKMGDLHNLTKISRKHYQFKIFFEHVVLLDI